MARVIQVGGDAVGGGTFLPIPVGAKLKMSIYDIEETVTGPNSKKPGTPQFVFTAKVTEDYPFTGVDPDTGAELTQNANGREIRYNYITLDPSAPGAWALAAFSEAVGWKISKGDNGKFNIELPDNLKEVQGTEFIGKVGQQRGQDGNVYNRVTGFKKLGTGGGGSPAPATAKSWDSL